MTNPYQSSSALQNETNFNYSLHISSHINLILCLFSSVHLIKFVLIYDGNLDEGRYYLDDLLPQIRKKLQIPFRIETFSVDFEEKSYDLTELFSHEGKRFNLRPRQMLDSVMVVDKKMTIRAKSGVVVIVSELTTLSKYLQGSARPPFKNAGGSFVIVSLEKAIESGMELLDSVFLRLWHDYGIMKAVIVFVNLEKDFFYFDHFTPKSRENGGMLKKCRNWGGVVHQDFKKSKEYCDRTLSTAYKNLNGYPLRTNNLETTSWKRFVSQGLRSTVDETSFNEALNFIPNMVLTVICQKLNMTPIKSVDQIPSLETNHTSDLVLFGQSSLTVDKVVTVVPGQLDLSYPTLVVKIHVMTPKAKVIERFLGYIRCFAPSTWLLIFVSHFALYFCFICIRRFYLGRRSERRNPILAMSILQDLCWLYASDSGLSPSGTQKVSARVILCLILFYSLTLSGIFEGFISTWFTTTTHYKDVETLEEVDNLDCLIYTNIPTFHKSLFDAADEDPVIKSLSNKTLLENNFVAIFKRMANGENICFLVTERQFEIMAARYANSEGPAFHLVSEYPKVVYESFVTRKDWFFREQFNSILAHLDSSGLIGYWRSKITDYIITKEHIRNKAVNSDPRRAINLNDLQIPFYILGIGFSLAFCVAICETLFYYWIKRA